jgi:iron complex outermembrane recepter protein
VELSFDCRVILLASAGALAFCSPATALPASTALPAAPDQPAAPTQPATATADLLQEVVVTGSRVITNNSNSPTPIMGIGTDQLKLADPGPIADSINLLPVFSGSKGLTSNPGIGATGVQGGNGAADVLNLRNLGPYRHPFQGDFFPLVNRRAVETWDETASFVAYPFFFLTFGLRG